METIGIEQDRPIPNMPLQDPTSSQLQDHVMVITKMRATDVATSLRRIPVGFYACIWIGNNEYRTTNKRVSLESGTIEWMDRFRLPTDTSTIVHLRIYASFELGPMLGRGELLRRFSMNVQDLIDRSNGARPIVFLPRDGEVVAACSSLEVNVCVLSHADLSSAVLSPRVIAESDVQHDMNLLTDAGHSHMLHYYRDPQKSHLDRAIIQYQKVLDRCPEDHICRGAVLSNMAMAKLISCLIRGAYFNLDIPISLYRQALDLRPQDHPDHAFTAINLANALLFRFNKRGYSADADEAEELLANMLDVCSANSHEHRAALFMVQTSVMHDKADRANGSSAAASRPSAGSGNWRLPYSLDQLYRMLNQCEYQNNSHLLDSVVSGYRHAEASYVTGGPEWIVIKSNLAAALSMRFDRQGWEEDLDEAIQHTRDALVWTSTGQAWLLNNLAVALRIRFELRGMANDLDDAIKFLRDALALRPIGHSRRSGTLNNLANAFRTRFRLRGMASDLDDAIKFLRDALALTPTGHSDRSMSLNNLAVALMTRFEQQGLASDLDEAIEFHRDALALTPTGHSHRSPSLNNLAGTLTTRFQLRGMASDLDEAIKLHRDALALTPTGHSDRSLSLNNLAGALTTRFQLRGMASDLDEAIKLHRDALALAPTGYSDRTMSLNNLAVALRTRFELRGMASDLDDAIKFHHDALALTPTGYSDHATSLNNLAVALMTRFEQQGLASDLDKVIELHRNALALRPVGHSGRSMSLNNLAIALATRFEQGGMASDLDEAIEFHRNALALRPTGHSHRSSSLNNLAVALIRRFEQGGMASDADEALTLCHAMETEIPSGHPVQTSICGNSARVNLALWNTSHIPTYLDIAMAHYRAAADVEPAGLLRRLRSCLAWVNHAEQHQHVSCLDAYTKSLQFLDAHVSATASVSDRHATMKQFPTSLAVDAASCALRQGDVPHALELLEQGRALLWNQLTRFRTPLDDLCSRGAHAESLVRRFQELSLYLSRQSTNEPEPSTGDLSKVTMEAEANRYRRLVDEWNQVVAEIRTFDGFSRFLLPPLFSHLQDAASEGPVVVLIASQFTCDAIIVLHDRPPIHIVLDITLERLVGLANQLLEHTFRSRDSQPRSAVGVLRQLWDAVMLPIVLKLEEFVQRGSRIWWCPTSIFTAFPLHAVGEYRKTSKRSVAVYTSSYTPSLSALIKARKTKFASSPVHFAAIGQALPDGHHVPLQCVDREVDEIGRLLFSSSTVFTKVPSVESTKQQAFHALQNNPWVHFSCHGTQNFDEPFKSHLAMRDGPLSLLDIINSDLSNHEFAFLSACKTAVGDMSTLDEAIHLAAGLQFMGVKSVVGTLWSVRDDVAYRLVVQFYKHFCSGGKIDPSRAARALHHAVLSLARDKEEPVALEDRMLFIHIGI